MAWGFARNNNNQLKRGKLITAQGGEYLRNYEEMTPRSYTIDNNFINGLDYVRALATIKISSEIPSSAGSTFELEEGIKYKVKTITPVTVNTKSRYSRNQVAWVLNLGE